ncbi:MAG: HNH endonuclease [Lentimicrobiaceae bacterium]|nr:HNH endonuclease [Lentimicrobiaceae bacterium]
MKENILIMSSRVAWTDEEMILSLDLYYKLPFGRLNQNTPEVKALAALIGRTPSSVALRLVNYAACDPEILSSGRKGMVSGIGKCKPFWDYYADNTEELFQQAENIKASRLAKTIEDVLQIESADFVGKEKDAVIKQRINQNSFRAIILANYDERCAISGLCIPQLLIASHIVPWADDVNNRLNPTNGICLSPLYDKAFDNGYISIRPDDYTVMISKELKSYRNRDFYQNYFAKIDNKPIMLPNKYNPNPIFLSYHIENIFGAHN